MLDSALSFERLVKNPKTGSKESGGKTQVTWDNPLELEAYIDKLQAAADKLTSENRRLRKCHYNINDKVQYLLDNSVHHSLTSETYAHVCTCSYYNNNISRGMNSSFSKRTGSR